MTMIPVGPGIPQGIAAVLKSHEDAIRAMQQPGGPTQFGSVATAATLPTAARDYANTGIVVVDKSCLAVCVDVAGTYTWLRSDGSSL